MRQSGYDMVDDDVLGELTEIYLEAARKDVSELESYISSVFEDRNLWENACLEMRKVTHNVKGQGTSFGYPLMTQIGESLSRLLKAIHQPQDPQLKLVEAHVTALRLVMDQNIQGQGGDQGTLLVSRLEDLVRKLAPA